ncbi:GNAT family N-acetyltransferase [Solicola gregarius]|uniref:GNAT family N-acetyltransferase n=1 Tax=Solicola gregarius TaxID=2908642 RepID=A0AA46YLX6_9ACTN|nr:GNAT family N-acetyltransferase [Solicola gregarius]UYM06059.1 GNAT family N-acetyltransferase [Solicola gregarius]
MRVLERDDMAAAARVLALIWQGRNGGGPIDAPLLVALSHGGGYVGGAFDGDTLIGVSAGFFAVPLGQALHSHITAVLPSHADRGVGRRLKEHQRDWCARLGIERIIWTYDPLVARNASFNLNTLGARVTAYVENFYGSLVDALNDGSGSDRLLVEWPTVRAGRSPTRPAPTDPTVVLGRDPRDRPVFVGSPDDARLCTIAVPADIELLRRDDPDLAARWRQTIRATLGVLMWDGWRVRGFARADGYLLERGC